MLVILAAAGVFGWMVFTTFRDADRAVEAESAALERLLEGPATPSEAGGYQFVEREGLLVARPTAGDRRWFATADGGRTVWEYDTVRHRMPAGHPDVKELRRWLALPPDDRGAPPIGWEAARADG